MSTCVPSGVARRRTTTSSRKPKTGVGASASSVASFVGRGAAPTGGGGLRRDRAAAARLRRHAAARLRHDALQRQRQDQLVVLGHAPGAAAAAGDGARQNGRVNVAGDGPAPRVDDVARREVDLAERQRIDVRHDVRIGLALQRGAAGIGVAVRRAWSGEQRRIVDVGGDVGQPRIGDRRRGDEAEHDEHGRGIDDAGDRRPAPSAPDFQMSASE